MQSTFSNVFKFKNSLSESLLFIRDYFSVNILGKSYHECRWFQFLEVSSFIELRVRFLPQGRRT